MSDPIRIGGLMRCCTQTLRDRETPGVEGDVQPCRWCSAQSIFRDGAWEWDQPASNDGGARPEGANERTTQ